MNSLEVVGILTEVLRKGERSCKFVIKQEKAELLGTITANNIKLADILEIGQAYRIKGNLAAFRRVKENKSFIENTFYAMEIEPVEVQLTY